MSRPLATSSRSSGSEITKSIYLLMWGKKTHPPKDYYSTLITVLIYWITKNHHLLGNYLKLVCSWIRENCPTIPIPFLYGFGWANCESIPFHLLVEWRCLITLVYLWNIHGCLYSMVSPYETNDTISAWVPQDISIQRCAKPASPVCTLLLILRPADKTLAQKLSAV